MITTSLLDFAGHTRPAQVGDLCVLLEPTQNAVDQLRERQASLQRRFGGVPIDHVHLTCQRFACDDPGRVQAIIADLAAIVAATPRFALRAVALETLYVPVLETNLLKWRIAIEPPLRHFIMHLRARLEALGIEPHYVAGFVPNLVAALRDVPDVDQAALAAYHELPYPLFTAGQVVLSRICGPNQFAIEGLVEW
jgi:hypothetical protein